MQCQKSWASLQAENLRVKLSCRELCSSFLTGAVFLCTALTGSRCTHREPQDGLAGCHGTVNYRRHGLETDRILLVLTLALQFIPSAVTVRFTRDTEVPREIPAADGACCKRELCSALCRGRGLRRARAAKRHRTIEESGMGGTSVSVNTFHRPHVR